jgi:hypothetical protein
VDETVTENEGESEWDTAELPSTTHLCFEMDADDAVDKEEETCETLNNP